MSNQLPPASIHLVKDNGKVKIHTLVAPAPFFANATHIIELPDELVLVDGQFFAQYGAAFRRLADNLHKPVTRYYVTHDHPDHYLGMGDAFPDVPVYALPEIIASIQKVGPHELEEKQRQMGSLIASRLVVPSHVVEPGEELIGGERFVFQRVLDTESPATLVIKLPELGVVIAQDIIYHNTHAFITGPVHNWKTALLQLSADKDYDTFLPGHGLPADKADLDNAVAYLARVEKIKRASRTADEYRQAVLDAYPNYGGTKLIDIYLPVLFPNK